MGLICNECGCRICTEDHTAIEHTIKTATLCRECLFWAAPEGEVADQIEAEVRSGSICHYCFTPLAPPGGTTIRSWDGQRMLRVCFACKEVFDAED